MAVLLLAGVTRNHRASRRACPSSELVAPYDDIVRAIDEDTSMNPMEGLRAAMAAVDGYYKERGIFQERFGFGERPALVVIAMAYGWTHPAYPGLSTPPAPPLRPL